MCKGFLCGIFFLVLKDAVRHAFKDKEMCEKRYVRSSFYRLQRYNIFEPIASFSPLGS